MSFRSKLLSGEPVVTVELSPPKGTDASFLLRSAAALKGRVDAINIPDCQLSILKMSSMAACCLIQAETGIETVWQLTCRDRNLLALQSDLLGGYALGLRNVLSLTGDPVQVGDQKEKAKQVFHLESVRLLDLLQTLNLGRDACGAELPRQGTDFTVGAALNPFRLSNRAQHLRLQQKMERQVLFFQTQPVYNADVAMQLRDILEESAAVVGCPRPKVLLGVIPPKSAQAARRMNAEIVGVNIPTHFIDLLERSSEPALESIRFCAELVNDMKPYVDGFHFMPVGMNGKIGQILDECFSVSSR